MNIEDAPTPSEGLASARLECALLRDALRSTVEWGEVLLNSIDEAREAFRAEFGVGLPMTGLSGFNVAVTNGRRTLNEDSPEGVSR